MSLVSQASSICKKLPLISKPQKSSGSVSQVNGIMFVSKPRGAKDDIVRTARSRDEAQVFAKTSALIVENRSKFLPRTGVPVRTRQHVIFNFEENEIVILMPLALESEKLVLNLPVKRDKITACNANVLLPEASAYRPIKVMKPKKRAEYIQTLCLAIESLSLLDIQNPLFVRRYPSLQNISTKLLEIARKKIDEFQAPMEEEFANTAAFQKSLNQVPAGVFVVGFGGLKSNWDYGAIVIHEGLEPLKPGERVYALTQEHSQILSNALSDGSAHARVAAMRLLDKVPIDHPAALPADIARNYKLFKAGGNVLARLEALKEMSEEDKIGEVFLLDHKMIDTYSSYKLPYGYEYGGPWHDILARHPLALSRRRSSLPRRPPADLITLDRILCVSSKAKSVLEELNLGTSKFHHIQKTDDYWAMEITEQKTGPIPDESLYQDVNNGIRTLRQANGKNFHYDEEVGYLAKRARFGSVNMLGPDVWLCKKFSLTSRRYTPAIVFSMEAITALRKAKCKWYKRVHTARVVDL